MTFTSLSHYRRINAYNLRTLRSNPIAELSGSLGDLGTLLPLMIALTLTDSIDLSSTLVFSGLANIGTGLAFGIPLPVQPMKAVASIAIANSYSKTETASAGLFVSAAIFVFSATGLLRWFSRVVPVPVVRGIQVGAGLSLVISAGSSLLQPLWTRPGWADNWILALFAFLALLVSTMAPRVPYALLITLLGVILAGIQLSTTSEHQTSDSPLWHPKIIVPSPADFGKGAIQAGLPQLPLTTLNSILAVTSLAASLTPPFPEYPSTTSIGFSVSVANLIAVWFGAMPVCRGSGGLAGQYRFGARSGASIIILGTVKLLLGLFAGERIVPLLRRFPKALLGVMVIAAGVELAKVGRNLEDEVAGCDGDSSGQTGDLWERTEGENERRRVEGDERRVPSEEETADKWVVMLVTVAGCLAFENDAVGFLAGLVWHWGLKLPQWSQAWRRNGRRPAWMQGRDDAEEQEQERALLST